jgi:hypothetical protein
MKGCVRLVAQALASEDGAPQLRRLVAGPISRHRRVCAGVRDLCACVTCVSVASVRAATLVM